MTEEKVLEQEVKATKTLDRKDLLKTCFHWALFPMVTINYERFQSLQYFCAMENVLDKLYDSKEDRVAAAKRHMEFYNTTPEWAGFTLGMNCAQEEQIANMPYGEERTALETSVTTVKASLMGPLAGIGDSLRATVDAIIGALAAGFALEGSILGAIILFVLAMSWYFGVSYFGFFYTYKNGMKVIRDMNKSGILDRLMEAATVLGMTSTGALVPSWCSFNLTSAIQIGEYTLNIQQELDNIIPGLAPLALTILLAVLYKKNVSSIKLVILMFVAAFILAVLL
ncbi:MAG: PTS system mannose/fructose/sorbose family transporter subunit IID [Traorella sp.]